MPLLNHLNPETPLIRKAFDRVRFYQHCSALKAAGIILPKAVSLGPEADQSELRRLVAERGYDWVDLPMENGHGYYRTSLSDVKLLRGIIIIDFLRRSRGMSIGQIQRCIGLQGGGQIAVSRDEVDQPLDRFSLSTEKVDELVHYLDVTEEHSAFRIIGAYYDYLHLLSQEPGRYRMAYRFFGNENGILPSLVKAFSDLSGSLLDFVGRK